VKANPAASIRARLLNLAKERGEDFNLTLNRYAVERYLYRLSQSKWRDNFLLKGAMLFDLWFDEPHRPTRDADFLGIEKNDIELLRSAVTEVCGIQVADGIEFDVKSITIEEIREDTQDGGLRVHAVGKLDNARCTMQLDVGYGDAVTPGPEDAECPVLLKDLPAPNLRVYPRATVVSEKLEAIVSLGMANTRMKDFFDIRALAREGKIDPVVLAEAIAATFTRRGTSLPSDRPLGLTDEFAENAAKLTQWKAFIDRSRLRAPSLHEVVEDIWDFVAEPLSVARKLASKP
jgi:predicted nucleotidyltransferase component of viral defense system